MAELARKDERVERRVLPRDEAIEHFKHQGEFYKAEIIASIPAGEDVSLYREGGFEDLCRGPHVPSTGRLKHFKLMKVAGAYWRGDHRNEMLQRIYGTAWASKDDLQKYLHMLEEAERRDHRRLGRELDLFHLDEHAPGLVFWHPRGWLLWQQVEQYMRAVYRDNGYQEVKGPQILDWMTTIFSFDQAGIPMVGRAIHQASRGKYGGLAEVRKKAREMAGISPVKSLSWGLHAATLCSDLSLPYSIGWTSRRNRVKATNRFLARAPGRDFGPFDRATARNNGVSQVCLDWPAIKVASPPKPGRLSQPTLILAGQYDLSTPVSYAKRELSRAPRGHLIVVPKAGHSVALRGSCADPGLASFLKGQPVGNPCQAGNHELQPRTISPWRIP